MTFDEWWEIAYETPSLVPSMLTKDQEYHCKISAQLSWDHQQVEIDELEKKLKDIHFTVGAFIEKRKKDE